MKEVGVGLFASLSVFIIAYCRYQKKRWQSSDSIISLQQFESTQVLAITEGQIRLLGLFPSISTTDRAIVIINQSKFTPACLDSLLKDLSLRSTHANDIYSDFQGSVRFQDLRVTIIYPATPKHINKYSSQTYRMVQETAQVYNTITRPFIEAQSPTKIQWVYNILDRKAEVEDVIVQDLDPETGFVLLPDTKWGKDRIPDSLYCLALCNDRKIKSLRDLRGSHLSLLCNIRDKSLAAIEENYGIKPSELRVFVHYQPSYYHFHIHFAHLTQIHGIFIGKAILLDDILYHLEQEPTYYEYAPLSYIVGELQHTELYHAFLRETLI